MQLSNLSSMKRHETKFTSEEAHIMTCLRKFQRRMCLKYLEGLVNVLRGVAILMLDLGKVIMEIDGQQNHF